MPTGETGKMLGRQREGEGERERERETVGGRNEIKPANVIL